MRFSGDRGDDQKPAEELYDGEERDGEAGWESAESDEGGAYVRTSGAVSITLELLIRLSSDNRTYV